MLTKHTPIKEMPPMPKLYHDSPPLDPVIFLDGSALQKFGVGGAVAWHEARDLDLQPISQLEDHVAKYQESVEGVGTYLDYTGGSMSSTHIECYGIVLGIAAPGAAHVGIDSSSCLHTIDKLLGDAPAYSKPRKPWSFLHDGDIQEIVFTTGHAKGRNAIKQTKANCNATDDDIAKGTSSPYHKMGNDKGVHFKVNGRCLLPMDWSGSPLYSGDCQAHRRQT